MNKIPRQVQSLYLSQTTEQEVKTSSGHDDMNNILLKN